MTDPSQCLCCGDGARGSFSCSDYLSIYYWCGSELFRRPPDSRWRLRMSLRCYLANVERMKEPQCSSCDDTGGEVGVILAWNGHWVWEGPPTSGLNLSLRNPRGKAMGSGVRAMPKAPIEMMLDAVQWVPLPPPDDTSSGLPWAEYEGTLHIMDKELKCFVLSDGTRVFEAESFAAFWGFSSAAEFRKDFAEKIERMR